MRYHFSYFKSSLQDEDHSQDLLLCFLFLSCFTILDRPVSTHFKDNLRRKGDMSSSYNDTQKAGSWGKRQTNGWNNELSPAAHQDFFFITLPFHVYDILRLTIISSKRYNAELFDGTSAPWVWAYQPAEEDNFSGQICRQPRDIGLWRGDKSYHAVGFLRYKPPPLYKHSVRLQRKRQKLVTVHATTRCLRFVKRHVQSYLCI
jgi:hypothetical protein